ncbi:MAG TPA: Maf family nucleotide pyrophosphatase [Acidiphilium sp.]|jgi:septum formation protein|uniref:Maf family protein n=1 Tax=unclassified Acidiphilium TaxID=2617493 RepID=UPI000BD1D8C1|nr:MULTISPECIES: Maf family nucleotide pyrophosphatase [unclassified Acidiphilium]OYV55125.1 MAG: septum formation protein Maf [Acidiphilium sp. 20-67-58]HQT61624.1 Maf family nucleotide pyrophosphatase [Acidiphilium sp.]HQU10919.1 Maf family nucleotide pyrophosphatase [Acidiphilium sp.]
MANLILASSSPRRLDLLRQLGIIPDSVISPDIDETPHKAESPRLYAARMAAEKLASVTVPGAFVIAADTVVALGGRILPKTETDAEARRCLDLLSGRRHRVYSAVAVRGPDGRIVARNVMTTVGFARLDRESADAYLASFEWRGKAGGYAIQGRAAGFVDFLAGSHSGVVGLPLHETLNLLRGLGWRP